MRSGEIKSLEWSRTDSDTIRLRAVDAKTGKPRSVPIDGEVAELVERCRVVQNEPWIFHCDGQQIGDFRKAWKNVAPVYRGKLFHDFRRTAVRDMLRGGVNPDVIRSITGHETQSMMSRYNIVDDRDQRAALRIMHAYRQEQDRVTLRTRIN